MLVTRGRRVREEPRAVVTPSKVPATLVAEDMGDQPAVLERLVARRGALRGELAPLGRRPIAWLLLVARGSSDNAATYGRYVLEAAVGCPAALSANSLFTRYACRTRLDGWLVIAVSQSGETTEITEVLQVTRGLGATTLAVTNDPASSLARAASAVVDLDAGRERAVPATKTYTATLLALALALALVAEALGQAPWQPGALEAIPALVDALLDDRPAIAGGTTALCAALPRLAALGIALEDLLAAATERPARLVGREDVGQLRLGAPADLVVLDDALGLEEVVVAGQPLDLGR
jgi:glucosamine--fructose-6-phosphate aminotransferase (isomerizing)